MAKVLLSFLIIFSMFSQISYADQTDIKLKKIYGKYLTEVPFFLRYAFHKKYNMQWDETYYFERKAFLKAYEDKSAQDKLREKQEAKAEEASERQKELEKQAELRKISDRKKAQMEQDRAEKQEAMARQKTFNNNIKDQERLLQQLQQQFQQEAQQSKR